MHGVGAHSLLPGRLAADVRGGCGWGAKAGLVDALCNTSFFLPSFMGWVVRPGQGRSIQKQGTLQYTPSTIAGRACKTELHVFSAEHMQHCSSICLRI